MFTSFSFLCQKTPLISLIFFFACFFLLCAGVSFSCFLSSLSLPSLPWPPYLPFIHASIHLQPVYKGQRGRGLEPHPGAFEREAGVVRLGRVATALNPNSPHVPHLRLIVPTPLLTYLKPLLPSFCTSLSAVHVRGILLEIST